jgi:hypothetical protein
VSDGNDEYEQLLLVDLVDDPVVASATDPDPPSARLANHRTTAGRTRLDPEAVKLAENPADRLTVELAELPAGSGGEFDPITARGGHTPSS